MENTSHLIIARQHDRTRDGTAAKFAAHRGGV